MDNNVLKHHGIFGMRWGRRRYQNQDGSLTTMGRQRYGISKRISRKSNEMRFAKNSYKYNGRNPLQRRAYEHYIKTGYDDYEARALARMKVKTAAIVSLAAVVTVASINSYFKPKNPIDALVKKANNPMKTKLVDIMSDTNKHIKISLEKDTPFLKGTKNSLNLTKDAIRLVNNPSVKIAASVVATKHAINTNDSRYAEIIADYRKTHPKTNLSYYDLLERAKAGMI